MIDYAQLAQSLKDNEAFQGALAQIRINALERLAGVDVEDKNAILKLQATVGVVDEINGNLRQFISSAAQAAKKPGIA